MPADMQHRWVTWGEQALANAAERRASTTGPTLDEPVEEVGGEIVQDPPTAAPPTEPDDVVDAEVEDTPRPWRMTAAQRKKLQATLAEAQVDDDLRHTLAALISDGRTRSSGELTRAEYDRLLTLAEHLREGAITIDFDQDGTILLAWAPARGGGPVDLERLTS
jgi:hypothetical protein